MLYIITKLKHVILHRQKSKGYLEWSTWILKASLLEDISLKKAAIVEDIKRIIWHIALSVK